jgi:hypothetical protein
MHARHGKLIFLTDKEARAGVEDPLRADVLQRIDPAERDAHQGPGLGGCAGWTDHARAG